MKSIFTKSAWEQMKTQGYYKPGITLSPETVAALRNVLDTPQTEGSPWSEFLFGADSKAAAEQYKHYTHENIRERFKHLAKSMIKKVFPCRTHNGFAEYRYRKSIYGTSKLLPKVLEELFAKGFADHLSDNHMLVAHDIYLENTTQQYGFGFHEDGWSLELLYNTGDDVSIYIPLQDHDANTGGRLHIDSHFARSERFTHRNRAIKKFSEFCLDHGCVDKDGYVTREEILKSNTALKKFSELRFQRIAMPQPTSESLSPVDSAIGEVILFPNMFFHAGEEWKPGNEGSKGLYFAALMPLYDLKIRPPSTFLNGEPCSRFVLDPANARAVPLDLNTNPIPECAIAMPE